MTAIYLTPTTGDGLTADTAHRAAITGPHACLMVDPARGRAIVVSPSDTLTGPGVTRLLTAATWPALVDRARTTTPTAGQLNAFNAWLTGAGYTPVPPAMTWLDCIHHAARQVNPAADVGLTSA